MRDEMFRRGGIRLPGIPPHDPYLEASRRYGAPGLPSPYSRKYNVLKVYEKKISIISGVNIFIKNILPLLKIIFYSDSTKVPTLIINKY